MRRKEIIGVGWVGSGIVLVVQDLGPYLGIWVIMWSPLEHGLLPEVSMRIILMEDIFLQLS